MTAKQIKGPFQVHKVEIILANDSPVAISKSMGLAMISFGELYENIKPDLIIVLGDRYEIACVCCSAAIFGIPIAHIHGGERSLGAYDEIFRNVCTAAASIHFPAAEEYRRKIAQMIEYKGLPVPIYEVGALGCEGLEKRKQKIKEDEQQYNKLMVVWHPVTANEESFRELLYVLRQRPEWKVFIMPNADNDNHFVRQAIEEFIARNDKCGFFISKGRKQYIESLLECNAIIGNSSSGIIEAPALGVPTINIGSRQEGRLMADSIIQADATVKSIRRAFDKLYSDKFQEIMKSNYYCPYLGGNVSGRIVKYIEEWFGKKKKNKTVAFDCYD